MGATLWEHASECELFIEELLDALTLDDVEFLREQCYGVGLDAVDNWIEDNAHEIARYIASTPQERHSFQKWNEQHVRPWLIYASLIQVQRARNMLAALDNFPFSHKESARSNAGMAGLAFLDVSKRNSTINLWPFPEPNPFTIYSGE